MKLSKDQKAKIREVAKQLVGRGNVTLELGHRYDRLSQWTGFNLDEELDCMDTDLDLTEPWSTAVRLDFPNDCALDWYVYSTGYWGQLETNLITRFRNGKMVEMFEHSPDPDLSKWQGNI